MFRGINDALSTNDESSYRAQAKARVTVCSALFALHQIWLFGDVHFCVFQQACSGLSDVIALVCASHTGMWRCVCV